jgi:hypothetical protein
MVFPNAEQSTPRFFPVAFPTRLRTRKIRPTGEGAIAETMGFMRGSLALVNFVVVLHPLTSTLWP